MIFIFWSMGNSPTGTVQTTVLAPEPKNQYPIYKILEFLEIHYKMLRFLVNHCKMFQFLMIYYKMLRFLVIHYGMIYSVDYTAWPSTSDQTKKTHDFPKSQNIPWSHWFTTSSNHGVLTMESLSDSLQNASKLRLNLKINDTV